MCFQIAKNAGIIMNKIGINQNVTSGTGVGDGLSCWLGEGFWDGGEEIVGAIVCWGVEGVIVGGVEVGRGLGFGVGDAVGVGDGVMLVSGMLYE